MGSRKQIQLEVLRRLVTKHIADASLIGLANADDFGITSTERGFSRYENTHLVAALDTLLAYQRDRRAKALGGLAVMRRSYTKDPRTRLIELLKRWLRASAPNKDLLEEDVHRMCMLFRDILNHPNLFPSRNTRSFMQTLAEVLQHFQVQLREVLERDRTCAELAVRCISLSRNLIADAIIFLLLATTDLRKTDKLPSVEVVALWQSLPGETNPLPSRANVALQKLMKDGWQTTCGAVVARLLSMPSTFRVFDSAGAEAEASATSFATSSAGQPTTAAETALAVAASADSMTTFFEEVRVELERDALKTNSGFAGPFRDPRLKKFRMTFVDAAETVFHLIYLLGEVLVHFQRISDGMGDYGMIRVAPWLHPFLDAIVDKVLGLKGHLTTLSAGMDTELVLAKARGQKVKKPVPTEIQLKRAHGAMERAVTAGESHSALLAKAIEDLRSRSAPERLPHMVEGIHDACMQLEHVFASPQFRECVGDAFPDLPALTEMAAARTQPTLFDADDGLTLAMEETFAVSDDEEEEQARARAAGSGVGSSWRHRENSLRRRVYDKAMQGFGCSAAGSSRSQEVVHAGRFPPEDTGLPSDCWVCRHRPDGRIQWHNTSLGPAPWELEQAEARATPAAVSPRSAASGPSPLRPPRPQATASTFAAPPRERPPPVSWLDPDERESPRSQNTAPPQPQLDRADTDLQQWTPTPVATRPAATATASAASSAPPSPGTSPRRLSTPPQSGAPPTPASLSSPARMLAEVWRLSLGAGGTSHRHDRRRLILEGCTLHVCEPGSVDQVKLSLDLANEVNEVVLLPHGVLSLQLRVQQRRRSSSRVRSLGYDRLRGAATGAPEQKTYAFEFDPPGHAADFRAEILRRREAACRSPFAQPTM